MLRWFHAIDDDWVYTDTNYENVQCGVLVVLNGPLWYDILTTRTDQCWWYDTNHRGSPIPLPELSYK